MIVFNQTGRFIGSTGLHYINGFETPIMHIGYWCRASEQGKGYVTEWVNALTRYGFEILGLKKISIHADSENEKSMAVPERLGYNFEYAAKGGMAKPGVDDLRMMNVYSCFCADDLPPLDVTWG